MLDFFRTVLFNSLKLVLSKPFVKLNFFSTIFGTIENREKRGLEYMRSSLSKKKGGGDI